MPETEEHHRRISALEDWRREVDISRAVENENRKHMDARFNVLEASISEIKDIFKRVQWMVVSAVVLAVVGFVIRGGLAG